MNNKKLIIYSFMVAIIVLVGIMLFLVINKNSEENPENIFKQYISHINEMKYDDMYELLTNNSKTSISKEDFVTRNKNIYQGIEMQDMSVEIKEVKNINNNQVIISYDMKMNTLGGEISFPNDVALIKDEEEKYKVEWSSKLIFPDLDNDDKIRVNTSKSERGNIYDRNDKLLAGKGIVNSVGLVPSKMSKDKESDILKVAELLDISVSNIKSNLNASWVKEDLFVPIKKISSNEQDLKNKLLQIPGIKITNVEERVYPLGEQAAHLVGYIQNISAEELENNKGNGYTSQSVIGKSGIEKTYEDKLRGIDGVEIYIENSKGQKKETIVNKQAKKGEDIKLTIDSTLQAKAYSQIKEDKGLVVVINPRTGEVLALVSTPTFNSNDFVLGMTDNKWKSLTEDSENPLYNRYEQVWSPGSTFKSVVGAIGVTTGKMDPTENYGKSGRSWQKDSSWGSYYVTTLTEYDEPANLKNALIRSDNIYFAKSALKIGKDAFTEQLNKIGFNETVPFVQTMVQSKFANNSNAFNTELLLANSGYGQGEILINPLHMASIYSAFVNDGNMIKPYIEYTADKIPEYWKMGAFSKEAANIIKNALIQVIESPVGTGHDARIDGLTIGGKTGTAEIKQSQNDASGTELGWFNAFTADEKSDKQLLVIGMIEDVKERGGSHYVIPKVRALFQ